MTPDTLGDRLDCWAVGVSVRAEGIADGVQFGRSSVQAGQRLQPAQGAFELADTAAGVCGEPVENIVSQSQLARFCPILQEGTAAGRQEWQQADHQSSGKARGKPRRKPDQLSRSLRGGEKQLLLPGPASAGKVRQSPSGPG